MLNHISLHQHGKMRFAALTLLTLLIFHHQNVQAFPVPGYDGVDPSIFKFKNVIRQDPPDEPGGWKTACANIPFLYVSWQTQEWTCELGIGVPEQNYKRKISNEVAQQESADAVNKAIPVVLRGGPYEPTTFCLELYLLTQVNLRATIPGARVGRCNMVGK